MPELMLPVWVFAVIVAAIGVASLAVTFRILWHCEDRANGVIRTPRYHRTR